VKSGESKYSKKSFGGEMGKPGSAFIVENVVFTVLNELKKKNRLVQCSICKEEKGKMLRTNAIRHVKNNHSE
jgi:hypothetical protein